MVIVQINSVTKVSYEVDRAVSFGSPNENEEYEICDPVILEDVK